MKDSKTLNINNHCILEDFKSLVELEGIAGFSGFSKLKAYYSYLEDPKLSKKKTFILFCIYRLSHKLDNKILKDFECDCSQKVTNLYKSTYTWLNHYEVEKVSKTSEKYQLRHTETNTVFKGDTLTSIFTPLKEYLKSKNRFKSTSSSNEEWEEFWLNNIDLISIPDFVSDFIYWGYSFANFLPVPQYFNSGRSNYGKWDSWDLTLNQIYQWYRDNPPISKKTAIGSLSKLFKTSGRQSEAVSNCSEWLKTFHSWENFVDQNYLQGFVQSDKKPIIFFTNHSLEYGLPKTLEEYEEFFKNVVLSIKEREHCIRKYLSL